MDEFINSSLTSNAVYAVMPILLNDNLIPSERFISIGGQLIMTRLVKPMSIMNKLEVNTKKLIPTYGLKGMLHGILCFK